jgi:hypothetical protein
MLPLRGDTPHPDLDLVADVVQPKPVSSPTLPEPPFSIHTTPQKYFIILLASTAGAFSTLCSYIYYPALVPIAAELNVSITLVNLTVTSYLLIAAVAPAFMGDMADQSGRRPIYMLMFGLFIGANVGIALQRSYSALLVLRMVQSAGSSGTRVRTDRRLRNLELTCWCRADCGCVRGHC